MTSEKEHEDWIRFNCYVEARKTMKNCYTDDIIFEAKKIENFVLDKKSAKIFSIRKK